MAKKGIEIDIAANTRDFQRGTKDVESALEEVADALDDVARDADKAGRKMGDELSDGAKDAERSVERVERSFKELADSAKRETRQAGDSMRTNVKRGADGANEAVAEWGDEAKANMSEAFSSFRGDAEDFVQIVQDTFGGVMTNLGPVGMAAGAAGAIGIGLMLGAFEEAKEAEQELREQVAELTDLLIDTGGDGAEAIQAVADRLRGLATETDKDAMSLEKLSAIAEQNSIDFAELADAYTKSGGDLQAYVAQIDKLAGASQKATAEAYASRDANRWQLAEQASGLATVSSELRTLAESQAQATANAEKWAQTDGPALAAKAEKLDALQGELDEAIGTWSDYYDAETGATDPAQYLAAMQARMDATANFNSNVSKLAQDFGLTFEEQQAIIDQGVDFAPMLQSIIESGLGDEYAAQIRQMLDGGQAIVDGQPLVAPVMTKADTGKAKSDLDQMAEPRVASITTQTDTSEVTEAIDTATADHEAEVTATADTTAAVAALDKAAKKRTAKITATSDTTTATTALDKAARKRTATIIVRADTAAAERAISRVRRLAEETVHLNVNARVNGKKIDW